MTESHEKTPDFPTSTQGNVGSSVPILTLQELHSQVSIAYSFWEKLSKT